MVKVISVKAMGTIVNSAKKVYVDAKGSQTAITLFNHKVGTMGGDIDGYVEGKLLAGQPAKLAGCLRYMLLANQATYMRQHIQGKTDLLPQLVKSKVLGHLAYFGSTKHLAKFGGSNNAAIKALLPTIQGMLIDWRNEFKLIDYSGLCRDFNL